MHKFAYAIKEFLTSSPKTKWFPELSALMFHLSGHVCTAEIYNWFCHDAFGSVV